MRREQVAEVLAQRHRQAPDSVVSDRAVRARLAVRDAVQNQFNLQPDLGNTARIAIESYLRVQLDTVEEQVGELVGLDISV